METVTRGCGCVFCDVGLIPLPRAEGGPLYHIMPDGRRIDCPIQDNPPLSGRAKSSLKSE